MEGKDAPYFPTSELPANREDRMRPEIMLCVKANRHEVTGDFWFMLAFRTESELVAICQELHIAIPDKANS